MKHFPLAAALPFLMLLLPLTGCGARSSVYSNYRAIGELRLVEALGYDAGTGGVVLSAAAGSAENDDALRLRCESDGILRAMDGLRNDTPEGELFFAHTRFIVVGRAAAERGIDPLLDLVERDETLRLGIKLFILEQGEAAGLVAGGPDVAMALASAQQNAERQGTSSVYSFREAAVALGEYGAAPVCLLRVTEGEDGWTAVAPAGYAILRGDRLAGVIEGEAAETLSLFLGGHGTVTRSLTLDGAQAVLRFDAAGGGAKPSWNADGSPGPVDICLSVRAVVAETDGGAEPDPDALADALRASVESDLRALVARAQALDADFLALGREMRITGKDRFSALPADWLRTLQFTFSVDAAVDRSYDLGAPAEGKEGGE